MQQYFKFIIFSHGTIVQTNLLRTFHGLKFQCTKACNDLRNQASWQRFDAKCGSNFNRVFLNISTHHSEMFEGTRFRKEESYISFRLKRFLELIIKSPWRWWVRGLSGIIECGPSVIPFQSKWNSLSSLIWGKMLFSILIQR